MRSSTLEPESVPVALRAVGYGRNGNEYTTIPSLPHGAFGSMGGMLVSARDLGRYVAFHLSAWPPRDDADPGPVRRSSVREMQHPWRPSGFRPDRASAYGYGLGVSQTCQFNRLVSHGGGLPGFGSNMTWLPDYGVGIFVMANLTYTGGGAAVEEAIEALRVTGALQPRELPPSQTLLTTRDGILRVWNSGSQRELEAMAADNLFQDTPAAARIQQMEGIRERVGKCGPAGDVKPENLLRGSFRLPCEKGVVSVSFTLAPTMPPKVQRLDAIVIPILPDAVRKSVVDMVAQEHGACRLGDTIGSNATRTTVRLDCERGPLVAQLEFEGGGKLKGVTYPKGDTSRCAP
jgi:Beta-lactamase